MNNLNKQDKQLAGFKKITREVKKEQKFSNFSPRLRIQMGDNEVFALALNKDGTLLASTMVDGSLHIVSTMLGDKLYTIKDAQMKFPITSIAWKPTLTDNCDGI